MDFSPEIKNIYRVNWSIAAQEKIEAIKLKYKFRDDYDLTKQLESTVNWYFHEFSILNQEPSVKESRDAINLLINNLRGMLDTTEILDALGTKIRGLLIDELNLSACSLHRRSINLNDETITVDSTLEKIEDGLDKLTPSIGRLLAASENALKKLPKPKAGRKNNSLSHRLLAYLGKLYEDGTGKMPSCEWNRTTEKPIGSFHKFLYEINSILSKECGISLGKKSTIIQYAKQFWYNYRKRI